MPISACATAVSCCSTKLSEEGLYRRRGGRRSATEVPRTFRVSDSQGMVQVLRFALDADPPVASSDTLAIRCNRTFAGSTSRGNMFATSLTHIIEAPAVTGVYAGAETVLRFGQVAGELHALRRGCGICDLGWRGKLMVSGEDRVRWLN